ncbi:RDD family protein, partial [Labilibacter marinus]|uniref:RDD family protein n=1 Tax=Labilibacter marinus TaxID=1477105 RepID=UPI000833DEB6
NRFTAGFIDYIIIYGFSYAYVYAFGEPNADGGYTVNGIGGIIPVAFWCIMTIGFEQWIGATIGNALVGLKPISIRGYVDIENAIIQNEKISFGQSLKRHLLDPLDMFFFGLIGIITIKNTDKNQRLGDIWANTIVIETSEFKKEE